MYRKINHKVVAELKNIVGEINCIQQEEKMEDYSHDEFSLMDIAHKPEAVVKPKTSEEISKILELANREKIPVTPRGGATGLCGGCVPFYGGIVLSLERMNRIHEVDIANQMGVVESGVRLADFYQAVEESGLFFPSHQTWSFQELRSGLGCCSSIRKNYQDWREDNEKQHGI